MVFWDRNNRQTELKKVNSLSSFLRRNLSAEDNCSGASEKESFLQLRSICRGVFFLALFFLPCPALPPAAQLFAEQRTYTMAAYPTNDPKKVYEAMKPLADYISAETGWTVRMVVTRNYEEIIRRLSDGSVDIAMLGSASYVRFGPSVPGLSYVATYIEEEGGEITPFYHSVILCLAGSAVTGLEGKNFAFTDRYSTSGYIVPLLLLRDRGIDPETFFGKVFFVGKHDAVIEALKARSVEGGAVSSGTLAAAEAVEGTIFRVLATSEPIPLDAVTAGRKMPQEHVTLLQEALRRLPPDSAPVTAIRKNLQWPAAGFAVLGDSFYDPLRRVLGIDHGE
jgi:phosphonate transport system substrate-binding protein